MTPGLNVATEEIDDILEVIKHFLFFTANRVDTFKALENYECAHRINEAPLKIYNKRQAP